MTKPVVVSMEPLTLAEVQATLKALRKRDEDLNFRGTKTEEYVNAVVKISKPKALELKKKIIDLEIPRLKEDQVIKVVDVLPVSVAELKVVLQGYSVTVTNENLQKIVDCVVEYAPKRK